MVSIMHANNEVGTLQPIQEIVETVKNHPCHSATSPILVHTDASQSIGKVRVSVQELGVDFLTIAGHKLYAPKGIGALYIRKGTSIPEVLIHGAAHENGKRAGTENVAFDVALGKACELIEQNLTSYETLLEGKKKELLELLNKFCDKSLMFQVNGHDLYTLPNTLSISFPGVSAVQVLKMLEAKGICASAGSACHSHTKDDNKQASIKISHVLQAMGLSSDLALGTLRLSVGRFTTSDELRYAAHAIAETVAAVKKKI
jgi:cysteine desulfurase